MYIDLEHKFLYLATPKTASSATSSALQNQLGIGPSHDHHGTLQDAKDRYDVYINQHDWIVCTTVRNHFDVIVSWFHREAPFSVEYLRQRMMSSRYWDYTNGKYFEYNHLNDVNFVIRYENLEQDMNRALSLAELPSIEIPVANTNNRPKDPGERPPRGYRRWFTEASRRMVEKRFASELNRLKYSW